MTMLLRTLSQEHLDNHGLTKVYVDASGCHNNVSLVSGCGEELIDIKGLTFKSAARPPKEVTACAQLVGQYLDNHIIEVKKYLQLRQQHKQFLKDFLTERVQAREEDNAIFNHIELNHPKYSRVSSVRYTDDKLDVTLLSNSLFTIEPVSCDAYLSEMPVLDKVKTAKYKKLVQKHQKITDKEVEMIEARTVLISCPI